MTGLPAIWGRWCWGGALPRTWHAQQGVVRGPVGAQVCHTIAVPWQPEESPQELFWSRGGVLLRTTQGCRPDLGTSLVQSARSTPSSSTPSSRPASLGYSGAAGPRPITQSELATALALASTPESSSHTPTPGTQVWREGVGRSRPSPQVWREGVGRFRPGPQGEGPSGRVGLPLLILVLHLL